MIDVSAGLEVVRKCLSRSVRQHIAQGSKSGVELSRVSEQFETFYDVSSAFLRNHGTPVFSKRYLTTQAEVFPDDTLFVGAVYQSKLLGGSISFYLGRTLFSFNMFSLDKNHKLRISHLLYWNRIERACERGLQRVDLGRSTIGSGQYAFKMSFNGVEFPIYQQFWLNRTERMPFVAEDAGGGTGGLFTRIWRHVPMPLTRLVGPTIRRELPFV